MPIIFTRPASHPKGAGVTVRYVMPGVDVQAQIQDAIDREGAVDTPTMVSNVPADRTYRKAWKRNGDKIETDMPKAREIAKERLRAVGKSPDASIDAAKDEAALKAAEKALSG